MADIDANFSLSSQSLNAGFELSETNVDAVFKINAAGTVWGTIGGTLSNQTDLQNALTTLQTNINNEGVARANADLLLETSINNHIADKTNPHEVTKAQVGLGNVDNTSDLSKPISTATQTALNGKQDNLTAGSNIQITNNTISATDTLYTAGDGLTLTGTVFSANVIDNVTSASSTNSLSAKQGKELNDRINNLLARGRYLSTWNCTTGLAGTTPTTLPYQYKTGDYFIVSVTGSTNYKPDGTQYTGTASSTVETNNVSINDTYYYDGTTWSLLHGADVSVTFGSLGGSPYDNTNLASALNSKQSTLTAGVNIQINNNTISATDTTYTAGTGISIVDNVISNTQTSAEWGSITGTLSDQTDLQTALNSKQDTLTAGSNIQINNNTISATDTTYTAGTGISIVDNVISNTQTSAEWGNITGTLSNQSDLNTALNGKQPTLVSGTNIKTINNTSILGSGDITIQSAPAIDNSTITQNANQQLQASALVDQRSGISKVWTGTKAQFDAIASKDNNTIYNVTDDYTGNSVAVVQEAGNSTSNVMSQKAVTEYPAVQNVYSPTMLFKKPTAGGQRYAQSLKTYTLDELKDVSIIQRAIRPSGTGINHYDAGGIPAIYLYKDNNNFIFFGVSGYSVKSTIKINGVMLEDVTLFTFSSGAGNINTSLNAYYRLDLHNKKMIMKNINETTGVEQILTEHDFSSLDISAFSDFYIRSGHSIYEIPVAVQHLAVNSILDYNTMLSQKLEHGRYNAFQTTDYNSNLAVASNGVGIAGTLSLDEPNHKISTVSQATMGYFRMGVNGTSATENTMNTVQCFKLKVTDGTMKIQQGASVNYGYVCEGDKVVYKLSSTPFTLTNNVEYTVYLKTFNTVNYARNYSFYAQGDFTVDISDGFLTFPASVNLCAETYNGKYFRGGLPCSGVNEEFLNYDNLFTTWNAYPSIPLYTQQVDTNGNILMFNGTAWKQVSN